MAFFSVHKPRHFEYYTPSAKSLMLTVPLKIAALWNVTSCSLVNLPVFLHTTEDLYHFLRNGDGLTHFFLDLD
jgi:hypothetical protein